MVQIPSLHLWSRKGPIVAPTQEEEDDDCEPQEDFSMYCQTTSISAASPPNTNVNNNIISSSFRMDVAWGNNDDDHEMMEDDNVDETMIPDDHFEEDYNDDNDHNGRSPSPLFLHSNFPLDTTYPNNNSLFLDICDVEGTDWYFRRILPCDRARIQNLHEEWFPVRYQMEFYDDLIHGKMCHTGEQLYTQLIVSRSDPMEIRACIVAAVVPATRINATSRQLLLPFSYHYNKTGNAPRHSKACYIMTLGTIDQYRGLGYATKLIDQCCRQIVQTDSECGALYLHVIISNQSAIRFYERLGFWRVQEIADYYYIDSEYYNCYLYAKYFHGNRGHLDLFQVMTWWIWSVWNKVLKKPFKYLAYASSSASATAAASLSYSDHPTAAADWTSSDKDQ